MFKKEITHHRQQEISPAKNDLQESPSVPPKVRTVISHFFTQICRLLFFSSDIIFLLYSLDLKLLYIAAYIIQRSDSKRIGKGSICIKSVLCLYIFTQFVHLHISFLFIDP